MNSRILASAALVLGAFGLTACNNQSADEVVEAPEGIAGIAVSNLRLVLPAVPSNPAVVYFDLTYDGDAPQTLAAVAVQGAQNTMMHDYAQNGDAMEMVPLDPIELAPGATVVFEPRGKHIMAMNVSPELTAGGKTEVTLVFANGDKQTEMADILAPGDAR
ncbi:copper chaperone PCu(A)C [Pontixanthobacter aestiaquae]|uniref:Copper chaperone PCu(A)C n=1 Tax=Pontixanthobacter aestiaquae TaxID=1509367 RepID=A0A844Z8M9_9SPHN|nr:copper chaperone PCu(A)C [Pontixanthobacter aestiaquae]MDN3645424.1 copper chaperone PCu(A)C [Pontixanthobacter aestiaquae]MXO83576.1 copper chaperone PCu(A)C [Pontixanthobacter aestiaquae]